MYQEGNSNGKTSIIYICKLIYFFFKNLFLNWIFCGFFSAYTIAKYGMSMCVLGMAEEFKGEVAVNALWPKTGIYFKKCIFGFSFIFLFFKFL